ncbi:DUF3631 domain-containing protein [Pseudomonas sp. 10B1]|uniref:DUF3631 domain-containing protein n=1 Tax=unclassified Pseudomonas TaxID=196821 RepID=UPI002B23B7C0|nr:MULTISPECIES: DUF3631 domain-containing protein [unclassified Pseudomonas]MEA9997199.1 DUF3631 domain-containing protein [Pseudomonas sp. AA4]MEB0088400.1 DUF3631 domain-containing protein [Pseudomonas sp. RTI1]MEB0128186.1 DUF3631 domain-containing protein [Pseudomonas sp. CCC1.2]MEB0155491.1 DUF3631 domain-containing protein [Pseudomonas sp. CCC4.3]MEB0181116.1 DUF3631 domain-containing protein [Pseudomonas sp. CCC3.2]
MDIKNAINLEPKCPLQEAIRQLSSDAGALYAPAILDELKRVRDADPAGWARLRQQIKETKVLSMADLDRLTAPVYEGKGSATDSFFTEVEPWPEPVDGAVLLQDVVTVMGQYVIADKETIRAAALWVVFTWLTDSVQVAPIAHITAPEKRCGKTVMLSTLGKLAYRPLQASDIATAALFRSIELWSPTLLIDEVDAFMRDNEEARGILNAGFTRDSAFVIRCVGDDHTPTKFKVWGAKALCGIGKIADTLADRSVPLRLRRKKPGETTAHLRHSDEAVWARLRSRIARFADDNAFVIGAARPTIIEGLNDRANDCWEPLLAIAGIAGGDWPVMARKAAISLHGLEGESPTVGVELLTDIRVIFERKQANKMFSSHLLDELMADDEAPWATWNRGKAMTSRQLKTKLSEFGIASKQIRIGYESGKMGYERSDFVEVWSRYLLAATPQKTSTPLQATVHKAYSVENASTQGAGVEVENTLQATDHKGCSDVEKNPPLEPEEDDDGVDI